MANKTQTQSQLCACGCGQPARRKYRPGHDAKHVSTLARLVTSGKIDRRQAVKELPSAPLQSKLRQRLDKAAA